jgi:hypothetical protein
MEIKFRGLRKDGKGWTYGYYFIDLENKLPYIMLSERKQTKEDWMVKSLEVIPETVGQYVGLTDKNGKEAYLGDKIESPLFGKGIVVWENYDSSFKVKWDTLCQASISHLKYSDIIGNIHENYGNTNN